MAEKTQFELVSPAKLLISAPVDMVVVPGGEGDFGALAEHAPVIATVRPGVIDVYEGGRITKRVFVAGGFAEVNEQRITVLAEEAIPVEDLTADAANARIKAAKEALSDAKSDLEKAKAQQQLLVAEAMLAAVA